MLVLVFQKDDLIAELRKEIQLKDLKIKELKEENEKLKKELRECTSLKQKVKKCGKDLEKLKKQNKLIKGKCLLVLQMRILSIFLNLGLRML